MHSWSNATTTLGVYGHFLQASDREAAAAMGNLLDAVVQAEERSVARPNLKVVESR
jgi:hypothetical protein